MSLSPSWSESNTSKVGGYASSTSELVQSLKGFVSGSFKISSCDRSIALPLLHGCPSLRQWIVSSWDPSTGRFSAQLVNDFLINSVGSWLQASRIHCRMVFLGGAFKFPAAVSSWIPTLLVGHVPIELSRLMKHYLNANSANKLFAYVTGKRKREVGLVVPARFTAMTTDLQTARILNKELNGKAIKYTHFELKNIVINESKTPKLF